MWGKYILINFVVDIPGLLHTSALSEGYEIYMPVILSETVVVCVLRVQVVSLLLARERALMPDLKQEQDT